MVCVLYSGAIQFLAECDLKLSRLSALTSACLAKFMKHNESNTAFLPEIVIIFSPSYLSKATYVIAHSI